MATDPLLPGPLWLVGCGNMGCAMLDGWIAAGVDPGHVSVIRPSGRDVGHGLKVGEVGDKPRREVRDRLAVKVSLKQCNWHGFLCP